MNYFYLLISLHIIIAISLAYEYSRYTTYDKIGNFVALLFLGLTVWPLVAIIGYKPYLDEKRRANAKRVTMNYWGKQELENLEIFKDDDFFGSFVFKDSYVTFELDFTYPFGKHDVY